jgi:hypothetical protein
MLFHHDSGNVRLSSTSKRQLAGKTKLTLLILHKLLV